MFGQVDRVWLIKYTYKLSYILIFIFTLNSRLTLCDHLKEVSFYSAFTNIQFLNSLNQKISKYPATGLSECSQNES